MTHATSNVFSAPPGGAVADGFSDKDLGAWVTDPLGTGSGKIADGIASWVDGESEAVPSGGAKK